MGFELGDFLLLGGETGGIGADVIDLVAWNGGKAVIHADGSAFGLIVPPFQN